MRMNATASALATALITVFAAGACGGDDEVSSDEEARRAYLGLDSSIEKALNLGMDGFNAAENANIPEQTGAGEVEGTIIVSGHVDAGVSPNKEMNLLVALVGYSDGPAVQVDDDDIDIVYDTDPVALPALNLSLRNIPDGTFTGSLLGTYAMTGALEGSVTLDLTMSGAIEDDGSGGIRRSPGGTDVTGTATAEDGTFDILLTI